MTICSLDVLLFLFASWQIVGETMQTVTDFIFGGTQITTDGEEEEL